MDKRPFYIPLLMIPAAFFHDLGKSVFEILSDLLHGVLYFLGRLLGWLWVRSANGRRFLGDKLKYFGIFLLSPITRVLAGFARVGKDAKKANNAGGMKKALPVFFLGLLRLFFGKRGAAVTIFNWAAPVVSIIFLVNVVTYATDMEYAVRLDVNGKFIGYIENELVYTEGYKIYEQLMNFRGASYYVEISPQFTIEKVGHSALLNSRSIANTLIENTGVSVEYAFGVIINNEFKGAVTDNTEILATLEALLNVHRVGAADEEVKFVQHIDCTQSDLYPSSTIIDPQSIIRNITRTREEAQYYTVEEGDSLSLITDELEVSLAELMRLNPFIADEDYILMPGDRLMYSAEVPELPVSVTRTEVYIQNTAFDTVYENDDATFTGQQRVSVAGEYGRDRVTARVTLVNGVETSRSITDSQTISEPVSRVILQGTRPVPSGTQVTNATASAGKFIWPISSKNVTEYGWWNGGYWGHTGIDIGAPYGTTIYAGASGTVVFKGWNSGYGNCIIIDHGDGLRTLYSHMSEYAAGLHVGQSVSQGEGIAYVGATGIATGNHLHFEVHLNGARVNPILYLD